MENITYLDWLKRLPSSDSEYSSCECPVCNSVGLSFQYFGFSDSEYGWKLVWCSTCKSGIRISRTRVPDTAEALISEDEQKEFLDQHTDIKLVA